MNGIKGRTYVITGGYSDIATAIASTLAAQGGRIVLLGRDVTKGGRKADELSREAGAEVCFLPVDVTDSQAVETTAARIESDFGGVDGLVVNAATAVLAKAIEHSDAQWRATMAVNLDAAFYCCRSFGSRMLVRGGAIVMISSIAARIDTPPARHIAYSVSKAGLSRLAELLAVEWADRGVRVNAVEPGHVETGKTPFIRKRAPEWVGKWTADTPIGRLILPQDVANMTAYLLSDLAAGVTGAVIPVDGGYAKTKS